MDFSGFVGVPIDPRLRIEVPGYGTVLLTAPLGSDLEIGEDLQDVSGNPVASLQLDGRESVVVTFEGATPTFVDFEFVGLSRAENVLEIVLGGNSHYLNLSEMEDVAGLRAISFQVIPEASSLMLVMLGTLAMGTRRRRGA